MGVTDGRIIKAMFVGLPLISTLPTEAMEISFDFITFIYLAAVVLGIVSSAIILFYGVEKHPANQPLAIGQLSISLAIVVGFSLVSKLILQWPFLYRMGHVFALIFIPMPYLYVLFYTKNRPWKWRDLIHAIPLLIYLVDYHHILLLSNAEKLLIIKEEVNDLNVLGQFRQSKYFGVDFHERFRTALLSVYWLAEAVLLVKWIKSQTLLTPQNKIWRNWIGFFLGCQFFMWAPFYLSFFGLNIMTTYHIVNSFSVVWIMISSLSLFFFPSLLYGKSMNISADAGRESNVLKKAPITDGEEKKLEEVMYRIETEMDGQRFFLIQGYSINDFSRDTQIPVYQISKCINHFREMSFVDFINQKRISFCKEKFDRGEWMNLTLEAVSESCGFTNRNSFTKAFQKFEGLTPSAYRLKGQNQEGILS
jgi:AraC-like DNA-binding protein